MLVLSLIFLIVLSYIYWELEISIDHEGRATHKPLKLFKKAKSWKITTRQPQ